MLILRCKLFAQWNGLGNYQARVATYEPIKQVNLCAYLDIYNLSFYQDRPQGWPVIWSPACTTHEYGNN